MGGVARQIAGPVAMATPAVARAGEFAQEFAKNSANKAVANELLPNSTHKYISIYILTAYICT